MPARRESLAVTDAYRARLVQIRDRATALVVRTWAATLDFDELDRSFADWLATSSALVEAGQRQAALLSSSYLAAYLSTELAETVSPAELDADSYAGRTSDGRPVAQVLGLAIVATKLAIRQQRPAHQALAAGAARAVRATRTEVMDSSRRALSDGMAADRRVKGYRRVVSGRNSCGACLGLAGGTRKTNKRLEIHASCRCTAEPVVAGVADTVQRPSGRELFDSMTPAEQDALFAGRGGAAKADLIRSGAVDLSDLVTRQTHAAWQDTITEAPLTALIS